MVMDYNGYDFSKKGQEKFYEDIMKQKKEIENMNIDENTREKLLSQKEDLIKEYERSKIRNLNSKIYKIRAEASSKKFHKASRTILSKLKDINDNLKHIEKMNVSGKHLMYGSMSWN